MEDIDKKVSLIHIPKTGGSSVAKALGLTDTHMPAYKRVIQHPHFRTSFRFTIIRNPWDRLFSWYLYSKRDKYYSFEDYVLKHAMLERFAVEHDVLIARQEMWFLSPGAQCLVNKFLYFENLEWEYFRLCKELKISPVPPLPHLHLNQEGVDRFHRRQVYTKQMRDAVAPAFARFGAKFGYRF